MRIIIVISLFLLICFQSFSQNTDQFFSIYIENVVEQLVSETDDDVDLETMLSELEFLYRFPLNLNNATTEEFEKLWILNDFQINTLIEHRRSMRQIVSIHELRYIYGFNDRIVELITPFIYCGTRNIKKNFEIEDLVKRSTHEILFRISNNGQKKGFPGTPWQHYVRYTGNFTKSLRIGLIGEKDAGEEFGKGVNKQGYDFYSGYVHLSTNTVAKNIVLGDYRIRIGQGLLIWNGYTSGKSSEISTLQKRGQGISGNSSKDEYNFLRGVSTTLSAKDLSLTIWGSRKLADGIVDSTNGSHFLKSLNVSGYHRTFTEIERKGNMEEISYGASISYKSSHFGGGIQWLHTNFSIPLKPSSEIYKVKNFSGSRYDGFSANYNALFQKVQLYGEVAFANNALAGVTGINMMPKSQFMTTLFYRNYEPEYYSPYANGLVESGNNSNEEGMFAGFKWQTEWNIILTGYADAFSIPWLAYQTNMPTNGKDYLLELNYRPNHDFELIGRYKYKEKGKNYNAVNQATKYIIPFEKQNLRLHVRYRLAPELVMASRVEWTNSGYQKKEHYEGYLIYQDIQYKPMINTTLYLRYAQFHISDYNSRMYAYENDVLYAYSMPAYFGKGQKIYFMLKQRWGRFLTLGLRYAYTNSFDINVNKKHEFRGQTIVKF